MVECYKIAHGYYNMQMILNFDTRSGLCGHSLKLAKKHTKKSVRNYYFSGRVVNSWNILSNELIVAPSSKSFEKR